MKMDQQIVLRPLSLRDTDSIVRWRNDFSVRKNLYSQEELTPEKHVAYFEKYIKTGKCKQYIIVAIDEGVKYDIGTAFLKNIDFQSRKSEFGMFVGEEQFRGKGYSLPAIKRVLEIAFSELNLNRVYLTVMSDNIPAIKAYSKAGFAVEGTLREDFYRYDGFVDVLYMGITSSDWKRDHKDY